MPGSAPLRPPPGIDAAEFFGKWLPEAFAAAGRAGIEDAPVVRITLSGAGGGDWRVRATPDRLEVEAVAAGTRGAGGAEVWVRQPMADFRATFGGDPDLPELLPPGWSLLDLLFLDPRDAEVMRQIDGRILIELAGKRRRRWSLDLGFGKAGVSAGRPRATVRIDAATFDGLRTRTMAPMQAMIAGGVKVEGDRSLAMQALLLTAARLSR